MQKATPYVVGAIALAGVLYMVRRRDDNAGSANVAPDPAGMTITDRIVQWIVVEIRTGIYGTSGWALTEDEARVISALLVCQTNDDVLAVVQRYGCYLPSPSVGCYDLAETLRRYLSDDDRAAINAGFDQRGISIRF